MHRDLIAPNNAVEQLRVFSRIVAIRNAFNTPENPDTAYKHMRELCDHLNISVSCPGTWEDLPILQVNMRGYKRKLGA
jgi:hypothetical protein